VQRVAKRAIEEFGGFDTWVNGAAVALYGTSDHIPVEDQRRLFEVNYWGVVNGSLTAASHLRPRGGAIINIGSVLSDRTMILQTAYSASKHAVKAFTDGLRMELEQAGAPVSVTLVKPSVIDTPYSEHARSYLEDAVRLPPLVYDPRLVAEAIAFAAEHPKRHMTVGLSGYMIGLLSAVLPRLTDRVMEWLGTSSQTTEHRARRGMRDNLHRPRQDGDDHSSLPYNIRRTSLSLMAQMHPLLAAAALAGLGAAITALILPRSSVGSAAHAMPREPASPPRREASTKRLGNGHDRDALGPGHVTQRDAPARPAQARH
jgi:short-subunit dehydrogenase